MAIGYTNPVWVDGSPPAIDATNLNAISTALETLADAADNGSGGVTPTKVWCDTNDGIGSGLDAGTCLAFGIGATTPQTMVTSFDNYTSGGFYVESTGTITNSPFAGEATAVMVIPYNGTGAARQIALNNSNPAPRMKMRTKSGATWGAWYEIWNASSDGNSGQPPAPKPQTGAGNIGIMTALDVASGGTLTMPAGSGTYQWVVMTYGATVNAVKTGQTAAGASPGGTASANCTVMVWRII